MMMMMMMMVVFVLMLLILLGAIELSSALSLNSLKKGCVSILGSSMILLSSSTVTLANSKVVGEIATSGIVFKDTLKIQSFRDPKLKNIVIYLSDFERPITEKLSNNFFDDPSSSSITCVKVGDVSLSDSKIDESSGGEEIFKENKNLFLKEVKVNRILDKDTNTLIYTSYSTRFDKNSDSNKGRYKSSMCAINVNPISIQ